MQRDARTAPRLSHFYLFSGFLRCADCGKSMGRRTSKTIVYYACKTYTTQGLCSRHSLRHDKLEPIVLEAIQKQVMLIGCIPKLIDDINKAPVTRSVSNQLKVSLKQRKQEFEKISKFRTGLYIDWKNGDITREEYQRMNREFERKEDQLRQDIIRLEDEHQTLVNGKPSVDPYFEAFLKYKNIVSLNRGIVTDLIKVIHIHEGGNITIDFNFADVYKRAIGLLKIIK